MGGAPVAAGRQHERGAAPASHLLHALPVAAALSRPVALAASRTLPVEDALAPLLPEGGLRRGSVLAVDGATAATSVALALVGAASRRGSWVAALGMPRLGIVAAAQLGVDLERLVLVPLGSGKAGGGPAGGRPAGGRPAGGVPAGGVQWPVVAAALLEGVDVLLLRLPGRVRTADARRLVARARERGAVLVVVGDRPAWPEASDLTLTVEAARWEGLGCGHGYLQARLVEVTAVGRRGAARPRRARLWLPGPDGQVAAVPSDGAGRDALRPGVATLPGAGGRAGAGPLPAAAVRS